MASNRKTRVQISLELSAKLDALTHTINRFAETERRAKSLRGMLKVGLSFGFGNQVMSQITAMPRRLKNMAVEALKTGVSYDSMRKRLDLAVGDQVQQKYEQLRRQADKYGLQIESIANAYAKIKVASDQSRMDPKETEILFDALLTSSAVLQMNQEQTNGVFLAFEQILNKDRVSAEELRRQLGDRLTGAFGMAAQAMGLTTRQLNEMIEQGKLQADVFLPRLVRQLLATFGPQIGQRMDSRLATLNRWRNAVYDLQVTFSESGAGETVFEQIEKMTGAFSDPEFVKSFNAFVQGMAKVAGWAVDLADFTVDMTSAAGATYGLAYEQGMFGWDQSIGRMLNPIKGVKDLLHLLSVSEEAGELLIAAQADSPASPLDGGEIVAYRNPPPLAAAGVASVGDLKSELAQLQSQLAILQTQTGRIEGDPFTTIDQKQQAVLPFLEKQLELMTKINAVRTQLSEHEDTDTLTSATLQQQIEQTINDMTELQTQVDITSSFGSQMQADLVAWLNGYGTLAQQTSGILTGTLTTAVDASSQAVANAVTGVQSWGAAWQQVGTSTIAVIMQLVTRLLILQAIMLAMNAIGAVFGVPNLGTMLVASGASFGGLFAEGGDLANGKWGIAGEAGPELIESTASGTKVTPLAKLAGMSFTSSASGISGSAPALPGALPGAAAPGGQGSMTAFFMDKNRLRDYFEGSPTFAKRVVDVIKTHGPELGL